MRVLLQILAQSFAEDAHPTPVDDAHPRHAGKKRAVNEFFDFAGGFIHSAADDVDFSGHVEAARFVLQRDGNPAGAGGLHRRVGGAGLYFRDVFAGDAHFHRTDFNVEVIVANFLFDDSGAAHRFELDGVALGDVLNHVGLGVRVSAIGSRRVRYDGGVELLAKFAAHFGDAAFGSRESLLAALCDLR